MLFFIAICLTEAHYVYMSHERSYPSEENLGKNCEFWQSFEDDAKRRLAHIAVGCIFPKYEMEGRLSCEGIIDDVCLYLKDRRIPKSLSDEQIDELRYRMPDGRNRDIPPGDVS